MLSFVMLLIASVSIYWHAHRYNETHKTVFSNINILIGQDIFLKRKDLVLKMHRILEKQKGVKLLVLVGQGGVGKTTLAKHYLRINDSKIKWEIDSATEESAIKSFLGLAMELSQNQYEKREELKYIQTIEAPEMKKQSLISLVFFQMKTNGKWCLLFDNVDDFGMIHALIPSNKDLCGEGTIIITTRNANCRNVSYIPKDSILDIEYLNDTEKKELFSRILYENKNIISKEVDDFLKEIPSAPLDVSHAAYYIKNTNDSFGKYLKMLKSPSEELDNLHIKFLEEGIRYNKTRYRITLAIFDKLIKINPNFKELLFFICLLDSKNIPRKYLDQCEEYAIVSNFIHNLKRFFSITLDNGRFSIHKSTQEIVLVYLMSLLTNAERETLLKKNN